MRPRTGSLVTVSGHSAAARDPRARTGSPLTAFGSGAAARNTHRVDG
ncbi:hypothetical protein J3R03_006784 [Actinoplanes couchii]|nr:hypothetical protein [Actinoplanes couchii]MDR6322588.1 hypothetical protein [Actinoplanes couchii]